METFQTSDNVRICYESVGSGIPIVLIHGWAATRNWWRRILPLDGYMAIIPDLRGHGNSSCGKNYHPIRMAEDILELLKHLGIENCIFVGHSLGGIVATIAAKISGADKLILVSPMIESTSTLRIVTTGLLIKRFNLLARRMITPRTLYRPTRELLEFIWTESSKGSPDAYIDTLLSFRSINTIKVLRSYHGRKILIIPEKDSLVPMAQQIIYLAEIVDRTMIIENVGHNCMLEAPEKFKKILLTALKNE